MESWPGLEKFKRHIHLPKNGLDLFLYENGTGLQRTVILLHGLGDEADTWRHLIQPLSQYCRVIVPDLPGSGRTTWLRGQGGRNPRQLYQMDLFRETLLELLEELSVPQAVWVGHSFGALLAHFMTLEYPEKAQGVVLVDGGLLTGRPRLNLTILLYMVPGIGERMYNRLRKNPQAAFSTLAPYYSNLNAFSEVERNYLLKRVNQRVWSNEQRDAFLWTMRNLVRFGLKEQRKLPERLARQQVPALVVWGEKDQITPVENAQFLAKSMPDARLVLISGAGHNVQQDRPQDLLEAILKDERFGF